MRKVKTINVRISQKELDAVIRVFESMHDNYNNPKIIDCVALMIGREEIQYIVTKLRKYQHGEEDASIPMNYNEWVMYTVPMTHADTSLTGITVDDLVIIEKLSDHYFDLDEQGLAPSGGLS